MDDPKLDPAEVALFERAMRQVEPLPPTETGANEAPRSPRPSAAKPSKRRRGRRLRVVEEDGRWFGLAEGLDRRRLRSLRRGQVPVDAEVDLHGFTEAEARAVVHEALSNASARGQRCLRIVHGAGRSSKGAPVLRRALPRWLADPPPGVEILAFTTAGPKLGGLGASLVELAVRR